MHRAIKLFDEDIGLNYLVICEDEETIYGVIRAADNSESEAKNFSRTELKELLEDFKFTDDDDDEFFASWQLKIISSLSLQQEIELIWPELIQELPEKLNFLQSWLKRAVPHVLEADKLIIEGESKLACKTLDCRQLRNYLTRKLSQFLNINFTIEFKNGDFAPKIERSTGVKVNSTKQSASDRESSQQNINDVKPKNNDRQAKQQEMVVFGDKISSRRRVFNLDEIPEEGKAVVEGEIFAVDKKETRNGRLLYLFSITDQNNSLQVKLFARDENELAMELKNGNKIRAAGNMQYDRYSRETVMMANNIMLIPVQERRDNCQKKRVELHLHTKMSQMDSVIDTDEVVERAADWGHDAIAITDHGVVQAFPEAYEAAQDNDIKLIMGMEAYLVDDGEKIIINPGDSGLQDQTFVVFDVETTGLESNKDRIIELGAVKVRDGKIIDDFSRLVNPRRKISKKIENLTGIKNRELKDAPFIEEILPDFLKFCEDSVLTAHNAEFDYAFLRQECMRSDCKIPRQPILDTLALSRAVKSDLNSHSLDSLTGIMDIQLENHHRAKADAEATAKILLSLLEEIEAKHNFSELRDINNLADNIEWKKQNYHHAVLLAQNKSGLKDLYYLVSRSHLYNFYQKPRVLKSELEQLRENILVGSACEAGEVFQAVLHQEEESKLKETAEFYDYLEIQPPGNNKFMIPEQVDSLAEIKDINRQICELGESLNKPVVATTDAHYLDEKDYIFREILQTGQDFDDADKQPPIYFKTTDEMLEICDYLGKDKAREVVINNPQKIAQKIEDIRPIPDDLFTPEIEDADEKVRNKAFTKARRLYGEPLPDLIKDRLEKELKAIIDNGYAVIYLISHKLVKKSLADGYLVGSRGSVGSSLVAFMTDITEVNPLPPHHRCPQCQEVEFHQEEEDIVGVDLPEKVCPECGSPMDTDGFAIPFEVFMGFDGNKVPDIDLNFSGEYQSKIHGETEKLFGEEYVYRAGTISTIADRTAYGFVKGYLQDKGLEKRSTEVNRLVQGCTGVKRTTGQHPGGLMVVPRDMDIHDFTPIQHPANDQDTEVQTTHFDYHAISGKILKLDLLGHDDPTSIRMLQDLTGKDPLEIDLDDEKTMSIFSGVEELELENNPLDLEVGTLGVPEFGTSFVRQMLVETRPKTFAELVRISGLSHGSDVWLNNARQLIKAGTAELKEVISVRDDIMNYLIQKGVEAKKSFEIMEDVRKGRGLSDQQERLIRQHDVPDWYINSCRKIKYMFPKAHAAAYVMMAYRIAYFKVYHPAEFYTTYFTNNSDCYEAGIINQGYDHILNYLSELQEKGNNRTPKENKLVTLLQIIIEAMERGIKFKPVDLYDSAIDTFQLRDSSLLPPLVGVQGLGGTAAENIVQARKQGEFMSVEDLIDRTGISTTVVEALRENGALTDMPEKNQLSLFE